MTLILNFDFGTGGVRAGVYHIEKRKMIATADETYQTNFPKVGWAEQNPEDWWVAALKAGSDAIKLAGSGDIKSVCVATTASTVVVCSKQGQPIRPAILWMDCRADKEARATENIKHPVMEYCGGGDAVEWLVPKAMWLSKNEPDAYVAADIICECIDYINYHLTGQWVGSRMNASCKWNYDSEKHEFVPEIYESLGIPELLDKLPKKIIAVGDKIGSLSSSATNKLGITCDAIVAQGGIDAHIGVLGAGTLPAGKMLMVGGTSIASLTHLQNKADVSGFWGPYPNALIDNLWLVESGQVAAGSMLSWLSENIFGLDEKGHHALIKESEENRNNNSGLLTLDYWMGNRTPHRDGKLRGAIMGLTLSHSRADIYASAVDSIALGSANIVESLEAVGVELDKIVIAGGICKNPMWLQSTIDALNREVFVVSADNLTLVGTAVCSAHALGIFSNLYEASNALAVEAEIMYPNLDRSLWYREALKLYRQVTQEMTPTFHTLADQQANGMSYDHK